MAFASKGGGIVLPKQHLESVALATLQKRLSMVQWWICIPCCTSRSKSSISISSSITPSVVTGLQPSETITFRCLSFKTHHLPLLGFTVFHKMTSSKQAREAGRHRCQKAGLSKTRTINSEQNHLKHLKYVKHSKQEGKMGQWDLRVVKTK